MSGQPRSTILCLLATALLLAAASTTAQQTVGGRVAGSSVGIVGQRQTRDQAASIIVPTARINGRIANRVQSRIRSRIDRGYAPPSETFSAFEIAEDQVRRGARSSRR